MGWCYLSSGVAAMLLLSPVWTKLSLWSLCMPLVYMALHISTWRKIKKSRGVALNPLLGETARNLLVFTLMLLMFVVISRFF